MEASMEWIKILGAIGFGAIVTKVLDVVWLQRAVRNAEKETWLRDKRILVFSELTEELLDGQLSKGIDRTNATRKIAFKALLLLPNPEDRKLLEVHFDDVIQTKQKIGQFINNGASTIEERAKLREKEEFRLQEQTKTIVEKLRAVLHA